MRDLCRHQHLNIVVLGKRCEIARICRLQATLEFTPEINFPAQIETRAISGAGDIFAVALLPAGKYFAVPDGGLRAA
ncbi:hypothetical protein D3C81_2060900 [compost metagenome]